SAQGNGGEVPRSPLAECTSGVLEETDMGNGNSGGRHVPSSSQPAAVALTQDEIMEEVGRLFDAYRKNVGRGYTPDVAAPGVGGGWTTSHTASGCRAATCSRTRAGPSGCRRPCSQLRRVPTLIPIRAANSRWESR